MAIECIAAGDEGSRRAAVQALTLAFVRDPVMRWLFPSPQAYLEHFPKFAAAFGGPAFDAGRDLFQAADELFGRKPGEFLTAPSV